VKRKILSPHQESNPRTLIIQPIAQHYTDWAITALWYKFLIGLPPTFPSSHPSLLLATSLSDLFVLVYHSYQGEGLSKLAIKHCPPHTRQQPLWLFLYLLHKNSLSGITNTSSQQSDPFKTTQYVCDCIVCGKFPVT
jgi:hypothetical protein